MFVSSEDQKILTHAEENGAEVIARPKSLASDISPEWYSWQHAVRHIELKYGNFNTFVSLPPTSPLRSLEDVESAINTLRKTKAQVCIGVSPASHSPYFNMVKSTQDGFFKLALTETATISRRQDVPKLFNITTCVYVTQPDYILNQSSLFEGTVAGIVIPRERAVDIDDMLDFTLAEALLQKTMENEF